MTDTDDASASSVLRLRVTDLLRDRDEAAIEQTVSATPEHAATVEPTMTQLRAFDTDGEPPDAVLFPDPMFRPASRDLVE